MELKKHITDERTGIGYTLCGDYYLPDLALPEQEYYSFELRLIIRALAEWRNILLAEQKPTEDIDELLIRLCK